MPSQLPPALSSTSWEAGDISGPLFWGPGFSQVKRGQMEGQKDGAGRVWRTQLKSAWEVLVIPSSLCTLPAAAEQEERAQPGMLICQELTCLRHWAVSPEAGLCWGLRQSGGDTVYPPSLSLLCRRFLSRRSMFKGRDSKVVTSPPKKSMKNEKLTCLSSATGGGKWRRTCQCSPLRRQSSLTLPFLSPRSPSVTISCRHFF